MTHMKKGMTRAGGDPTDDRPAIRPKWLMQMTMVKMTMVKMAMVKMAIFLFLRRASVSEAVQRCVSKAVQHFYLCSRTRCIVCG